MIDRKTKLIGIGVLFGTTALLTVFGAGAYLMATSNVRVGGDLRSAGDYTPTSEWVEDGLDPNVTTFGFEGKGAVAEPSGPELSEYQIQQLVYEKQNDLMGCYASGLQENEDLKGKVDFRFGIAPDGHVAMVKVTSSSLADKGTEDCMVAKARSWSFPRTNRASLMKFDTDFTFTYE